MLLALATIFGVAVVGYRIIGGESYGWLDGGMQLIVMGDPASVQAPAARAA